MVRNDRAIVDDVDWTVRAGERWVVLGPNGSGKTTLLQVVGARLWPTCGVVDILGHRLGSVDVRTLRPRVALVSGSVIRQLRGDLTAREVVATGRYGALEPWWDRYTDDDWARADRLLADVGGGDDGDTRRNGDASGDGAAGRVEADGEGDDGERRSDGERRDDGGIGGRRFGVISEGEQQRVLLARALMSNPELLLLDEPAAGLDLGARERLVTRLSRLCADPAVPPLVMVTHHAEEIPPGITHTALVSDGRLVAAGPLDHTLTSAAVSDCFGLAVTVGRDGGRWWSRAAV
ncbi:MAG TPA: ATP-binding cassette domain-containing protein [Acidimicrobiales bacterium]|nr:ATP-binding cassette domain-containing protein [Acidimicrobiales bacterium]